MPNESKLRLATTERRAPTAVENEAASPAAGGGLFFNFSANGTVSHATIWGNFAFNLLGPNGGGFFNNGGTVTLRYSIVAMPPIPGSPATNAATGSLSPTDQRGFIASAHPISARPNSRSTLISSVSG